MDREERLNMLLELVIEGHFATQEELVEALEGRGVKVTQSSVSRDIRELGLRKRGGIYVASAEMLAGPSGLDMWSFATSVVAAGDHMIVIRCRPATAQTLAMEVDASRWHGVAGTIAGDDTVFVAVTSAAACKEIVQRVRIIAGLD